MTPKEGYDVLRLIEHGQICYISSEYVEGEVLAGWIKTHADIPKEQLFSLIESIAKQLSMIHKCRKKPAYQYVNPYSIVVTREEGAYFLDMEDGSNEEHLRFMQKRPVRECFLPKEEPYYQRASIELDIYGLGKTIQYLLSMAGPNPPLSRREEKKFLKIISKCLRYQSRSSYVNVSEIRRQIPRYQQKKKHENMGRKRMLLAAGIVILCAVFWNVRRYSPGLGMKSEAERGISLKEPENMESEDEENAKVSVSKSRKRSKTVSSKDMEDVRRSYMELAVMYITDVEDYHKSIECLEKIEEGYAPAGNLKKVAKALLGNKEDMEGLEESLKNLMRLGNLENVDNPGYLDYLKSRSGSDDLVGMDSSDDPDSLEDLDGGIPVDDGVRYYLCLIKGYAVLDTKQSAESILYLGKLCLDQSQAEGRTGCKIRGYMASACEKTDRLEDAAHLYEEILAEETDIGKREEMYRKIVSLYGDCGQNAMALDSCVHGMEEIAGSEGLMLLHIRLLCEDAAIDRNLCAQTIQEYLRRKPEISEKEEFQKLQREYEIQMEGDNVWVGR